MFTCFFPPFRKYADDMEEAGVRWQRMGLGSTLPDIQDKARELGMVLDTGIDGMPPATDPSDPCYPVTDTKAMEAFLKPYAAKALPSVRIWECFDKPNGKTHWTQPGYINYVKAAATRQRYPEGILNRPQHDAGGVVPGGRPGTGAGGASTG